MTAKTVADFEPGCICELCKSLSTTLIDGTDFADRFEAIPCSCEQGIERNSR